MYPILTRFGSFFVYSYTVVMGVGLLLAVWVAAWERRRETEDGGRGMEAWVDGVIAAVLVGLVVGRVVFVGVNWGYYADNVGEGWLLWQGGISYHGAVGAGLTALWMWSRFRGVSFARLGDLLALPMALWSASGWLACYLEGCAYGRETFMGRLAADLPDSFGVFAVRYQTQLMGLAFSLLALGVLWWARGQVKDGNLFWLALFLLSAGRAVVDMFRGDPMPALAGQRVDVVLDAALAVGALLAVAIGTAKVKNVREDYES